MFLFAMLTFLALASEKEYSWKEVNKPAILFIYCPRAPVTALSSSCTNFLIYPFLPLPPSSPPIPAIFPYFLSLHKCAIHENQI